MMARAAYNTNAACRCEAESGSSFGSIENLVEVGLRRQRTLLAENPIYLFSEPGKLSVVRYPISSENADPCWPSRNSNREVRVLKCIV